jgi:2-polyprenyl-3-methyl-5-hydroxy-6-metoxy-1,4-benzoquinol methylase
MNNDMSVFTDPKSGEPLLFKCEKLVNSNNQAYAIKNKIPRFVTSENYTADFGLQWNKFRTTQLDSHSNTNISERRLERCVGGDLQCLQDARILEAGSGAGRFTEIFLKHGGIVHSFDSSTAVEANALNHASNSNLTLAQADIFQIPFPNNYYDYVCCLGVLQHTPDPERGIHCLWQKVAPGGVLVLDHYLQSKKFSLPWPLVESLGLYRKIILAVSREKRFNYVKNLVDFWFPIHWIFRESPVVQRFLRRLSPVIFHYGTHNLATKQQYYEWSLLDTHDATTDHYKYRRSELQIRKTLENLGAIEIEVSEGGNGVEARCRKPQRY